jgi:hypothetical protein
MKPKLIGLIIPLCSLLTTNAQDTVYGNIDKRSDYLTFEKYYPKTDTTESDNIRKAFSYGGFGLGFGNRGGILGLDYTFILSNNWGGNISTKINVAKSKDIPDDFYQYGIFRTTPYDYVFILSFNMVKEFPGLKKNQRFGIEAGPSWVNCQKADFRDYKDVYSYNHIKSNTMGVSLRGKIEFMPIKYIGLEIATFANINSIKPIIGIEFFFHFGKVRD